MDSQDKAQRSSTLFRSTWQGKLQRGSSQDARGTWPCGIFGGGAGDNGRVKESGHSGGCNPCPLLMTVSMASPKSSDQSGDG
ncbi:uncharacterized protein BJX67DRAFT_77208 [Aspergillus lucknowensis]|uniref:Uncharacterized protein n=1 Tax=Aspergillus lucknowensis TaxID=176173 RepID=A0ABR4LTB5_9EURO